MQVAARRDPSALDSTVVRASCPMFLLKSADVAVVTVHKVSWGPGLEL